MQVFGRQDNTISCARCGAENYPFASFCIACGEPFDESADADRPAGDAFQETTLPEFAIPAPNPNPIPKIQFRKLKRRETVLGLLLVVLVVGYAIYDWQRNTIQSAAYREGVVAEQSKDWDRAAEAFEKAGDHKDADSKAHNARFQVAERNSLYVQGIEAAQRQDWKTAASALEQVQMIQPAFADSDRVLVQARAQTFKHELNGLVYQVNSGPAAGLYVLDSEGKPSPLPGSDGHSAVRAASSDGNNLVYDGTAPPDLNAALENAREFSLPRVYDAQNAGRVPLLATLEGGLVKSRSLPALNGEGTGIFSAGGIWWYSGWYSEPQNTGYNQYEIFYNDYQLTPAHATRILSPFSSRRVLAFDPSRSRLVIGEGLGEPGTTNRKTDIYLANADAGDLERVDIVDGDVQAASVSSDGHWLLAVAQYQSDHVERSVWLMPLGTQDGAASRKLESAAWSTRGTPTDLSAAFLPSQPSPSQVVVDRIEGGAETLTAYGLAGNTVTRIGERAAAKRQADEEGQAYTDMAGLSNNGQYMARLRRSGSTATLEAWGLTGQDSGHNWSVALPTEGWPAAKLRFAPSSNYVLVDVQGSGDPRRQALQSIYSVPIRSEMGPGEARLIATASTTYGKDLSTLALTAGGSLLAYVNDKHELHAVFYDGQGDTLLAEGVGSVWSLCKDAVSCSSDLTWAR